jgi:hypothetical protein
MPPDGCCCKMDILSTCPLGCPCRLTKLAARASSPWKEGTPPDGCCCKLDIRSICLLGCPCKLLACAESPAKEATPPDGCCCRLDIRSSPGEGPGSCPLGCPCRLPKLPVLVGPWPGGGALRTGEGPRLLQCCIFTRPTAAPSCCCKLFALAMAVGKCWPLPARLTSDDQKEHHAHISQCLNDQAHMEV